ncbi:MAG: hypothetical protein NUV67_05570, partial [archaeon]|nr:hypothetical protein [archaeon]
MQQDINKNIEPQLEIETYVEIIKQINSLGMNLERSSKSIRGLGEEPLRDIFLAALNSVYGGVAT